MTLPELLVELDTSQDQIPLDSLQQQLADTTIPLADVQDQIIFRPERYQRNLIQAGPHYYALVMCWQSGQQSPIHDHRAASCGVKVLHGTATEIRFQRDANGMLTVADTSHFVTGAVCGSFDADIHQIRNDASENLITLHIYSPFLNNVHIYSLEDTSVQLFTDPIVEQLQKRQG
jgi:cysteine dioxygenase